MKNTILISFLLLTQFVSAQIGAFGGVQYNLEKLSLRYTIGLGLNLNNISVTVNTGYGGFSSKSSSETILDTSYYFNSTRLPRQLQNITKSSPKLGWEIGLRYNMNLGKVNLTYGCWANKSNMITSKSGYMFWSSYLVHKPNGKIFAVNSLSYMDTTEKTNTKGLGLHLGISINLGKRLSLSAAMRPSLFYIINQVEIGADIYSWDRTPEYGFIQAQHSRIAYNTEQIIFRPLAAPVIGMSYLIFSE